MPLPLNETDLKVLDVLDVHGGYTAGQIAERMGLVGRSETAKLRTRVLAHLVKVEVVGTLDDGKPTVYVATNLGRATREAYREEEREDRSN